jgi:hypothetical protein
MTIICFFRNHMIKSYTTKKLQIYNLIMKEINIKLIKKFIAHKMKIKFKYKKTQIYKNRYISKNKKNYTNKFYSKI